MKQAHGNLLTEGASAPTIRLGARKESGWSRPYAARACRTPEVWVHSAAKLPSYIM